MEAIGPSGTLVALAFTPDFYFWQKKRAAQFPFIRGQSPIPGHSLKSFWITLYRRSRHPTNSFVALGPNADEIARGHDENETAFYPLKKLMWGWRGSRET